MVTTEISAEKTIITLWPNRSIEWQEIKYWLIIISLPALVIAFGWFFVGVWVVLPFAGIELSLLAYFMYKVCYQNYRQQQIIIQHSKVSVNSGIHRIDKHHHFERPDCYLQVTPPSSPSQNMTLELFNAQEALTIGEFLNPEDKEVARQALVSAGIIECLSQWWKK